MKSRTKSILGFLGFMAFALFVYIWYYPLNKGKVEVRITPSGGFVAIDGLVTQCPQDPCVISLKTGSHEVKMQKDGYFPETVKVSIQRFKTEAAGASLKKIPTLTMSAVTPQKKASIEKALPDVWATLGIKTYTWDSKGEQLALLDPADEKIKVWSGGQTKVITALKGLGGGLALEWAPDGKTLLGHLGRDFYWIDIERASRRKMILGFDPLRLRWAPQSDSILINDAKDQIYQLEGGSLTSKPLSLNINLDHVVWDKDGKNLVFFRYDPKANTSTIEAYNPAADETQNITTKYNFPISEIATDDSGAVYLYHEAEKSWYVLES